MTGVLKQIRTFFPGGEGDTPTCVLLIGDTGQGKSTLVNVFCGENMAQVSAGAESMTIECKMYDDSEHKSRKWLDTRGLNDSTQIPDDIIRSDIMHTLYKNFIQNIRIVWMATANLRCSADLQTQAEFILSLSEYTDHESSSIWNSVIIVLKEKDLKPGSNDLQGPFEAARRYGAENNPRAIGYTCLESLTGEEATKRKIQRYRKDDERKDDERIEEGFLFNDEIRQKLEEYLDGMASFEVHFREKLCTQCGICGDDRCVPPGCHPSCEMIHPEEKELIHQKPIQENRINVCPRGHKLFAIDEGSKTCDNCKLTWEILYHCEICNKRYCANVSNTTLGQKAVLATVGTVAVAGVVAGAAGATVGATGVAVSTAAVAVDVAPAVISGATGAAGKILVDAATVGAVSSVAVGAGVKIGSAALDAIGKVGETTKRVFVRSERCAKLHFAYPCCNRLRTEPGCAYKCCKTTVGGSGGCRRVCHVCRMPWGTRASEVCDRKAPHDMKPIS